MHRLAASAALLAVALGFAPVEAQEPAASRTPSIVTTGEAVVRRAPDQAFLIAAVEARARNPRDAQRQNADTMTAVQQRLAAAAIPRDAVRTLGYNIQQEFDFVDARRVSRGYIARNAIEIRVDAIDRTGEMLDLAVQAGATAIVSVRFDLKDRGAAEREALRLAVVDARARADAAAAGVGRTVDSVLRIDDTPQPRFMPQRGTAVAREAADAAATPIEAGELEIRAQVTLTVSLK